MLGIIYSPVLSPCAQMSYTTQLIAAPPAQLLPGLWGNSPAMAQPVSHALSPAIAKPCGEGTRSILARAGSSCAFLQPQESHKAQFWLLTLLSHHQEGGALPSLGLLSSAAELLLSGSHSGCGMLCLAQNSSLWCNPGGGVIASLEGKLPSSSPGTAKALPASQGEHLSLCNFKNSLS